MKKLLMEIYLINHFLMAEGVGLEPTKPVRAPVFETGAIDHYATLPSAGLELSQTRSVISILV